MNKISEASLAALAADAEGDEVALNEALLDARRLEWMNSLYYFGTECLGNNRDTHPTLAGLEQPNVKAMVDWVGEQVLEWLRTRDRRDTFMRVVVNVPRECFKTAALTTVLPVWANLHDPNISCVVDSSKFDGLGGSADMMSVIQTHFSGSRPNSLLKETFGEFGSHSTKDRTGKQLVWRNDKLNTLRRTDPGQKDFTVAATSVDKGGTGSHPDLWIWDDPVTDDNRGETWFKRCWEHWAEIYPILGPKSFFLLIMTRWDDGDPTGRIIEEIITPRLTIQMPDKTLPPNFRKQWWKFAKQAGWRAYVDQVMDESGKTRFPFIWPQRRVEEYMYDHPADFAAQCMNAPERRVDSPLSEELIEKLHVNREDIPPAAWRNVHMPCDLALKSFKAYIEGTGDYNVIQAWGTCDKGIKWQLPLAHRGRDQRDEFMKQFLMIYEAVLREGGWINFVTFDKSTGGVGDMVENWFTDSLLAAGLPVPCIVPLSRTGSKDDRSMMAARYWASYKVRLCRGTPYQQFLTDEFLRLGTTLHDDMRDAASDVFDPMVFEVGRNVAPRAHQLARSAERAVGGYTPYPSRYSRAVKLQDPEGLAIPRELRGEWTP